MVRTAATAVRVSGGKSAKAARNSAPSCSGLQSLRNSGSIGGNPPQHREIPTWQKPITSFFRKPEIGESSSASTSARTSNEILVTTDEKENVLCPPSQFALRKENGENVENKNSSDCTSTSGKECSPQSSGHNENKSESENKENKNCNTVDFPKKNTSRDEDGADLLPAKRPRIDYRKLEAIEKFAR